MAIMGVMITNGPGGHPSWKHADVTASKLIIDPLAENDQDGTKLEAAKALRHKVRVLLEAHHEAVKGHELAMLERYGHRRHEQPLEPDPQHVDAALAAILPLTYGTVLESHFARPEVRMAMRDVLAHEFRTQQYIHREWHKARVNEPPPTH